MRTEQEIRTLINQLGTYSVEEDGLDKIHHTILNILHWVLNEESTNG
jgi:hypothetical protein